MLSPRKLINVASDYSDSRIVWFFPRASTTFLVSGWSKSSNFTPFGVVISTFSIPRCLNTRTLQGPFADSVHPLRSCCINPMIILALEARPRVGASHP